MNMKELFLRLFKPDLTITQNVGRYLACQQYQQCSVYLHKCKKETPKLLKRNFNFLIGISQNPEKMHRYKFVNELYELVFKEKSKYYNEAFYKQCVEAEPNEMDKPVDAYITALQPYFKD